MKTFMSIITIIFAVVLFSIGFIKVSKDYYEKHNTQKTEIGTKILQAEKDHHSDVLSQGGVTDKDFHPEWDANIIVYKIHDDRDITTNVYIREFTPYGNPNLRCVVTEQEGGITCFDYVKREKKENDEEN